MNKKLQVIFIAAMLLALALTGCERSASKAPVTTAQATGELPFPVPVSTNPLGNILSRTQTAQAQGPTPAAGQTQPAPATNNGSGPTQPAVVLPTNTLPPPATPTVAPTFAIVPSATPGLPTTYTLHQGEWPFCIARRFNINPSDLLAANGLTTNSRPAAGTDLNIPQGVSAWSAGSRSLVDHPAVYSVKAGDSIYSIACDFGDADPNAIIAANHLQSPYELTPGQSLQVP